MTTPPQHRLSWDAVLDDYEDRIDDMWHALEMGTAPNARPFEPPVGGHPGPPSAAQLERLGALQTDAAQAETEFAQRISDLRHQRADLRRSGEARRAYGDAARLAR